MKVRKGQRVRIARTNEIAKVLDVQLIRKAGSVHQYCHLQAKHGYDLWLDSSELADVKEKEVVTFKSEDGRVLEVTVVNDFDKKRTEVNLNASTQKI